MDGGGLVSHNRDMGTSTRNGQQCCLLCSDTELTKLRIGSTIGAKRTTTYSSRFFQSSVAYGRPRL